MATYINTLHTNPRGVSKSILGGTKTTLPKKKLSGVKLLSQAVAGMRKPLEQAGAELAAKGVDVKKLPGVFQNKPQGALAPAKQVQAKDVAPGSQLGDVADPAVAAAAEKERKRKLALETARASATPKTILGA